MTTPSTKKRVLSGMRSTGKLHLGNYVGALENWVRMQDQYDCFFFIADWHALTTDYADTSRVKKTPSMFCSTGSPPDSIPKNA
jgi:tryptophanyl-tRNA synthetase